MTPVDLYLALCWFGHDAGQHQIIVQYLELTPRACRAEIRIHQSQHPQDHRNCECVPFQQVDVTPHTVEILPPRQPEHHVRVTIHRQATPVWPFLIPAIVVFAFVAGRFLFIPLIVVMAIFTAYPAIGITFALWLVLIIGIAIHQRWRGHPF
jgi:hypothetical protein